MLNTSSFNTALGSPHFGSGKRVLFKCGDTFSGDKATLTATTASIGAYGGCQGTQTSQPIFNDTSSGAYQLDIHAPRQEICELPTSISTATAAARVRYSGDVRRPSFDIPFQITLWNLQSTGSAAGYYWAQGAQWGLIGSTQLNSRGNIAVFVNSNESNPTQWKGTYPNLDYQAAMGNFVNGVGAAGGGGSQESKPFACRPAGW